MLSKWPRSTTLTPLSPLSPLSSVTHLTHLLHPSHPSHPSLLTHLSHPSQVYDTLFDHILFKYADGWVNEPNLGEGVGYPATWLKAVGYPEGPPPIKSESGVRESAGACARLDGGCDRKE